MRRRRRRPGGLESEFVLAKGRRRLQGRVGKKFKKKIKKKRRDSGRVTERKKMETEMQMEWGESSENWQKDRH